VVNGKTAPYTLDVHRGDADLNCSLAACARAHPSRSIDTAAMSVQASCDITFEDAQPRLFCRSATRSAGDPDDTQRARRCGRFVATLARGGCATAKPQPEEGAGRSRFDSNCGPERFDEEDDMRHGAPLLHDKGRRVASAIQIQSRGGRRREACDCEKGLARQMSMHEG